MDLEANSSVPLPSSENVFQEGIGPSSNDTPDPFALFNAFLPGFSGFSIFSQAIKTYLGIDLTLYIPVIAAVCGVMYAWGYLSDAFWAIIDKHLTSSLKVQPDDEIYNILMAWVARQNFSRSARRFIVNTDLQVGRFIWHRFYDEDNEDVDDNDEGEDFDPNSGVIPGNPDSKKKRLRYTPSFGSHFFWYKGRCLLFDRQENREARSWYKVADTECISITCLGRSPAILKELLLEARTEYLKRDEHKTIIYRASGGQMNSEPEWERCMARSNRPFSTVILNEKTKTELIDDIKDYLHPTTRRWYANRGIPYRRGYMLYGPPGTGKSSLSLALAGYFRMRIYIVSLNSIVASEENLSSLFASLPRRCMVLLEDIDTAGLTHTRDNEPENNDNEATSASSSTPKGQPPHHPSAAPPAPAGPPGRLSLSGLLNILDGVASQEGRILIMTTNHIEKLDKALIRPGRVDLKVEFSLADRELAASIFRAIYAPYDGEVAPNLGPSPPNNAESDSGKAPKNENTRIIKQVDKLAEEFGRRLPELEFSPAEIQGLLLRNKRSPAAAIEQIDEWMEQTRAERKEREAIEAEKRRKQEAKWLKKQEKKRKRKEKRKAKKKAETSTINDKQSDKNKNAPIAASDSASSSSDTESDAESMSKTPKAAKSRGGPKIGRKGLPNRKAAKADAGSSSSSSSDSSSDDSDADARTRGGRTGETTPEPAEPPAKDAKPVDVKESGSTKEDATAPTSGKET